MIFIDEDKQSIASEISILKTLLGKETFMAKMIYMGTAKDYKNQRLANFITLGSFWFGTKPNSSNGNQYIQYQKYGYFLNFDIVICVNK